MSPPNRVSSFGMDPSPLELLLLVGLTARAIRLAVVDDIAGPARVAAVRVAGVAGARASRWTAALLSCPFCIGFWISLIVAASWVAWGDTVGWRLAALAGTLSYVSGHAVARLDQPDEE